MLKLMIGVAAIALAGTTSIAAQPSSPQAGVSTPVPTDQRVHMRMMSDKVMTRDETVTHVQKLFARLDSNRDGFITREEADATMKRGLHRRLDAAAGPRPDRAAMFARLDSNKDGMISRDEYMAARPEMREQRFVFRTEVGAPGGPGQGMGMHRMGMMGHLFEMADADHDGRVSLAEATNAAARHFDQADLNHDGKLTPDERRQAHQMMRAQRS